MKTQLKFYALLILLFSSKLYCMEKLIGNPQEDPEEEIEKKLYYKFISKIIKIKNIEKNNLKEEDLKKAMQERLESMELALLLKKRGELLDGLLYDAVEKNCTKWITFLVKKLNIDVDLMLLRRNSVLSVAVECNNIEAVKELIRMGADVSFGIPSPLAISKEKGHKEIEDSLLQNGAKLYWEISPDKTNIEEKKKKTNNNN